MDVKEIIQMLEKKENIKDYRLYFTRKKNKDTYLSYSPIIEEGVNEKLVEIILDMLGKRDNLQIAEFSPIGCYDETLEACKITEIENFDNVLQSLEEENVERENIDENEIGKLNFYCFSVDYSTEDGERNIKFFRRITKFKKLAAKGMFGQIKNNRFSKVEADMLGVDGDVDIIVCGDEMLILNHVSLERIFSVSDQYIEKAKEAIDKIERAGKISNFEQFKEDCKNDRRITRILTKLLSEEEKLEHCFENFQNVKKAIEIFELPINIENSGNGEVLVYEGKDQLMDMVRLIRDSYYRSIIGERPGVDDSL